MKNMSIIWTGKIKLWKKWHFVENRTEIMQNILQNVVNFIVT
jgi:hypothetical protein